jgi:hypothetical protein
MKIYTDEEKILMNDVLSELHEYIDTMDEEANEIGKNFKAWLFEGDWFLDFCKQYRFGEDNAGLTLGFIINFDMWINDSAVWPVYYNPKWEKK